MNSSTEFVCKWNLISDHLCCKKPESGAYLIYRIVPPYWRNVWSVKRTGREKTYTLFLWMEVVFSFVKTLWIS
jgi:hypothetical protein